MRAGCEWPVRLLPRAAAASWAALRTAAFSIRALAGRAVGRERRALGDGCPRRFQAGGGASLRAVAEGSPRIRASLDLVRAPEKTGGARGPAVAPS